MTPVRIQRRRTKGWRMPEGAVIVSRPSRWGNPWEIVAIRRTWLDEFAKRTGYSVVDRFRGTTLGSFMSKERAAYWAVVGFRRDFDGDLEPLRGHDLACWCPLCDVHRDGLPLGVTCPDCAPCHGDVLLILANR